MIRINYKSQDLKKQLRTAGGTIAVVSFLYLYGEDAFSSLGDENYLNIIVLLLQF
ncbi:hypothetical protein HZC32_03035 [Candidatus Woesearchaeota archaeon]|nr:hypothetical protein [Candidatus Woesearchaeota archaeon]